MDKISIKIFTVGVFIITIGCVFLIFVAIKSLS